MGSVERAIIATPISSAAGRVIASPFQFYTTGEESLRLVTLNSAAGVVLTISGRFLSPSGDILVSRWTHTPNTDRTAKGEVFPLAPGAILNIEIFASTGVPKFGQCYVILALARGDLPALTLFGRLLQGYVTPFGALSYPGSPIASATDGEPPPRTIVGTLPAAGNDVVETVPTGARWELLSVHSTLTMGAAGLASPVAFTLDDGTNTFSRSGTGNAGGATTINPVCFAVGVQQQTVAVAGGVFLGAPITNNRLLAGHRFRLHTDVNPAQVTWAAPVYNVREWLEA